MQGERTATLAGSNFESWAKNAVCSAADSSGQKVKRWPWPTASNEALRVSTASGAGASVELRSSLMWLMADDIVVIFSGV